MKKIILLFCLMAAFTAKSQATENFYAKNKEAKKKLEKAYNKFNDCLVITDCEACIDALVKEASDPHKKYLVALLLNDIDREKVFMLNKEAYMADKNNLAFMLEYAMGLHRNKQFSEAIPLYEKYKAAKPGEFLVKVWLADCYISTGNIEKAQEYWNSIDFASQHVDIDFALHSIYGDAALVKKRSDYKNRIAKGETGLLVDLIFLDRNWEIDWWNTIEQENFLAEDLKFAEKALGKAHPQLKILTTYIKCKDLSKTGTADEIRALLTENNIILDNKPLVQSGVLLSDMLRICFMSGVLSPEEFYKNRGSELLDLAKKSKDHEMLNVYAYLQATVDGMVSPEIDKYGWKEFKDERFAMSYFIGKADNNRFDDPELAQALADFPESAKLQWIKVNCAFIEQKDFMPELIKLMQKEFKSLDSDDHRYSYSLNNYFNYLAEAN
jgi:hypothetical protein